MWLYLRDSPGAWVDVKRIIKEVLQDFFSKLFRKLPRIKSQVKTLIIVKREKISEHHYYCRLITFEAEIQDMKSLDWLINLLFSREFIYFKANQKRKHY